MNMIPYHRLNTIAIVQMWPNIETAEDEVISRIKKACNHLDLSVILIDTSGFILDENGERIRKIKKEDVDFTLHIHFETPKAYDTFSFVALWNPLQFYVDWGYRKYSSNLVTHDDFLSCGSKTADDHVSRMLRAKSYPLDVKTTLFHSLSEPILAPKVQDPKIFYVGINWEKLGKGKGRHDNLLKSLDKSNDIRIYGPEVFQGVKVWEGYNNYVKSIPFDGTSVVEEINKSGVALVLSSDAHKESALMSNRLFESLAAGAVIIVDENSFARKHFGNTLLYIQTSHQEAEKVTEQVREHLNWIKTNPKKAEKMAQDAQNIFLDKFLMHHSLSGIYATLEERKNTVAATYNSQSTSFKVNFFSLFLECDICQIEETLESYSEQTYKHKSICLIIDEEFYNTNINAIKIAIDKYQSDTIKVVLAPYSISVGDSKHRLSNIGQIIEPLIEAIPENELFMFKNSNEYFYSEHMSNLVRPFEDNKDLDLVESNYLMKFDYEGDDKYLVSEMHIPFLKAKGLWSPFSHMMFKKTAHMPFNSDVTPYLDWSFIDVYFLHSKCKKNTGRATTTFVLEDSPKEYKTVPNDELSFVLDQFSGAERSAILTSMREDYQSIYDPTVNTNSLLDSMPVKERRLFLANLIKSLSLPKYTRTFTRYIWRYLNRI